MPSTVTDNLRQAAIVLAAVGADVAADICRRLPADLVMDLGEAIAQLGEVTPEELEGTLAELSRGMAPGTRLGGSNYAQELLYGTLGASLPGRGNAEPEPAELTVLGRLNTVAPPALYKLLQNECRQILAAVVSHLTAGRAAQLLANYPEDVAADIAYRAAHLAPPAPGALQALAGALERELRATQVQAQQAHDVSLQYVVDLIGALPTGKSKSMLEALGQLDKTFGDSVAELVFTFEDITRLADPELQLLLRNVDMSQLVVALKGTPEELRDRVRANLSQRGRERLTEEMEILGPVPLAQVQDAQRQICAQARQLAEQGDINLDSGAEEYVE